jgi:sugar/nucleoside kinase (ribokinase family)
VRLTTLGDLLLDVIVRVDGPLVPGDDARAATIVAPGGQAANVAAWAAALGATARVVCRVGNDDAGRLVRTALHARGVEVSGPVAGRTGIVVSIAAGGDRTMASDRGTAPELSPHDLDRAWFDCDVLHVSGYALLREPIASAAVAAARLARDHDARVSFDVSSSSLVDDRCRKLARELAPELTFATEAEQAAIGPLDTDWVLKRGARGLSAGGREYTALPVDVVDTTGAGDALAAGFLVGGAELGLEAAARCCAQAGALP